MFTLFSISCLATAILSIGLGIFTYVKNKDSLVNKYWAIISLLVASWSLGLWGVINAHSESTGLLWQYLLDTSAIFIPVFFLGFVFAFTEKKNHKAMLISWISTGLLFILSFTPFFKIGLAPKLAFNYWVVPGPLYFLFPLFFAVHVAFILYFLASAYRHSSGNKRNQIKFVLITAIIGFGGGPTNFLPQFFDIYPVGQFFFGFYIFSVAYAITRYRLMDIRFVLRRLSVIIASLVSIVLPAVIMKNVVNNIFSITVEWVDYLVLIIAITFFPALRRYYYRVANKYFFTSLYDAQEVIGKLSDKLSSTLRARQVYQYITDSLVSSLHSNTISVFIFSKHKKQYQLKYHYGEKDNKPKDFVEDKGFYTKFLQSNKPVVVEDIKRSGYVQFRKLVDMLLANDMELIIPLRLRDQTIGVITLGKKESKDIYNTDDLSFLEIIGSQSAIAINNALSYEEIKNFSNKLQLEVEKATEGLIQANARLKQLDEAKSEFVSIASHQLRTPLTVIKGYVAMILEGNFGRVNKSQRESMEKVFASNERLIHLVENLLNISRIESGRLHFNFETTRLENLVGSVVDELKNYATKRGLKYKFVKSKKKLPKTKIDQEKMRQVILNLIDNAIKYTKEGGITISLSEEDENLKICVEDTGMGIKTEDLGDLFEKFSRGTGTALIDTEGTGLGLFVADQMVKAHNGKIWAESNGTGRGSRFCFTLPITDKDPIDQ